MMRLSRMKRLLHSFLNNILNLCFCCNSQFRVKPTPDPLRVEETTWMTKENIDAESLKLSTNWIEVGNGDLGKLYVEVLGCDNLVMHNRPAISACTDINAFACLIFEDCIVNTDVINDDANPKWMPWSQRAFMFHVRHPSSQLMLGMFTLDEFITSAIVDSGAPIGRVVIPLTNFCPSTKYTLQFPLYTESGSKELSSGTVTLRVRIEWENERHALIKSLSPRSTIFVSVANKNEFTAAYYTAAGKVRIAAGLSWWRDLVEPTQCLILFHRLKQKPLSHRRSCRATSKSSRPI